MKAFNFCMLFLLFVVGCASPNRAPAMKKEFMRSNPRQGIITVALIVETTLEELGSFEVNLKFNNEDLRFVEFMPMPELDYEIDYSLDENAAKLKVIGYNSGQMGRKGSFKIAHIYFKNIGKIRSSSRQRQNFELSSLNAYSPLPEQKEIKPSFTLSLYEGYITK